MLKLTNENYFSQEASREYLSTSQYKDFIGTQGRPGCEERALAIIAGNYKQEMSVALLQGSYIDAHFEETLDIFKAQHPELFKKTGDHGLLSTYEHANEVISRVERDKLFMQYMSGKKQVIMEGVIAGSKYKIKIDSYIEGQAIVDLKYMEDIEKTFYVKDIGHMNFVPYWGYDLQGAIYQEIVYQNTGKRLPFFIAVADKKPTTNLEIVYVDDKHLHEKLIEVETNTPKIIALKSGAIKPFRCEKCDYCKLTKVLTKPKHFSEIGVY